MVRGWAFGLLRLSREEFGEMRVGVFHEAMWAYNQQVEADRRHAGELIRGATIRLFNTQVAKRSRMTEVEKFWRMPWDSESPTLTDAVAAIDRMSDEERKASALSLIERLNNGKTGESQDGNNG